MISSHRYDVELEILEKVRTSDTILQKGEKHLNLFLNEIAREVAVPVHMVSTRAKSYESFKIKLSNKLDSIVARDTNMPLSTETVTADKILGQINDLLAGRIITYTDSELKDILKRLEEKFDLIEKPFNPAIERSRHDPENNNGYYSIHLVAGDFATDSSGNYKFEDANRYRDLGKVFKKFNGVEIQLRTVSAHGWAEYEHRVIYKGDRIDSLSTFEQSLVKRLFRAAANSRATIDEIFDQIAKITNDQASRVTSSVPLRPSLSHEKRTRGSKPKHSKIKTPISETQSQSLSPLELCWDLPIGDSLWPDLEESRNQIIASRIKKLSEFKNVNLPGVIADADLDRLVKVLEYPKDVGKLTILEDILLSAYEEDYIDCVEDSDDKFVLSMRLRRIQGKFKIYQVQNQQQCYDNLTAAGTVRSLLQIYVRREGKLPPDAESFVSENLDRLASKDRATSFSVDGKNYYLSGVMNRSMAEAKMAVMLTWLADSSIIVYKAGDAFCRWSDDHNDLLYFQGR